VQVETHYRNGCYSNSQCDNPVPPGLSDYGGGRSLDNTLNNYAGDMVQTLTMLGFEVTLLTNNDLRSLRKIAH